MLDKISNKLLIKKEERRNLAFFIILFLVIGCGMVIGRSSADALFFKRYGIEYLPLMYILLGGVLFIVTILYAAFTDRFPPERFLKPLLMIVAAVLLACWFSMSYFNWEPVYPVYFIVYEVVSEIILVHCTIYVARNLDVLQAKRLTPLILGGWTAGAIIGGFILIFVTSTLGAHNVLLIWVFLLLVAVAMVYLHHRKNGESAYYRAGRRGQNQLKHAYEQLSQCIIFVRHSRLLQAMSFALFFMVVTFYILCYSVNRVYTETFVSEDDLTIFYGVLSASTGVLALIIQIFFTNRLIRRFGVRNMNLVFPITTMIALGGLLFSFVFSAAIFSSLVKDSLMPAFRNPIRALFFNAIPTHMQGRAHSFSIGIVLPLALSFAGLSLLIAQSVENPIYFLGAGLLTSAAYFFFNIKMNNHYLSTIITGLKEKLFIPNSGLKESVLGEEREAFDVLLQASKHNDQEIRFLSAKSMLDLFPARSANIVIEVLSGLTPPLRDQLIRMLVPLEPNELGDKLWQELDRGDTHLRATILFALFLLRDNKARDLVLPAIRDENPRIKSVGIYGALNYPVEELSIEACNQWKDMLEGDDISSSIAGLDLLHQWPNTELSASLLMLLRSSDQRIQKRALLALSVWPDNDLQVDKLLNTYLQSEDYSIRVSAVSCLQKTNLENRRNIAKKMLEDVHPEVREAAVNVLFEGKDDSDILAEWIMSNNGPPKSQESILRHLFIKNPPRRILEKLTHYFSGEAEKLLLARSYLMQKKSEMLTLSSELEILIHVLDERGRELIDLALQSVKEIEDPYTIGVIRAGINSKEQHHWAKSCEAIRFIHDKDLADSLALVLERLGGSGVSTSEVDQGHGNNLKSIIGSLGEREDPWLSLCLKQFNLKAAV